MHTHRRAYWLLPPAASWRARGFASRQFSGSSRARSGSPEGLAWCPVWRGSGTRAAEDASGDIRAFQRAVEGATLRTAPNLLLIHAMGESHVVRDSEGRAVAIRQARTRARIDPLQAAVIAVGLGEPARRPRRPGKVYVA